MHRPRPERSESRCESRDGEAFALYRRKTCTAAKEERWVAESPSVRILAAMDQAVMTPRPLHVILSLVGGLTLLTAVLIAGVEARPALIILPMALIWIVSKVAAAWSVWVSNVEAKGAGVIAPMVTATVMVQLLFVAIFYSVGRLVALAQGVEPHQGGLEGFDGRLLAVALILGAPLRAIGGFLAARELRAAYAVVGESGAAAEPGRESPDGRAAGK